MTTYTITDMTTSRTLGEVTATTVRGARVKAARVFNTRYGWVMAYPQTDASDIEASRAESDWLPSGNVTLLPSGNVTWIGGE
jgi:hypothetical protein